MKPKSGIAPGEPGKRKYSKPTLVHHGNVTQLTKTGGFGYADNYQKNCNHSRPNTNINCGSLG